MKILLVTAALLAPFAAHANMVCEGKSPHSGISFRVEQTEREVIVTSDFLDRPHVFTNLTEVNGLVTAPGLALSVKNEYGCLRDATIITELREPLGGGVGSPGRSLSALPRIV